MTHTRTTWIHPNAAEIVRKAFDQARKENLEPLQRRDNRDKFNRKRNPHNA